MRDSWADAFADTARAYWTADRLDELARGKFLAIQPHQAPTLLRALGILHRDASMPPAERRKFFQINHMVAALGPSLRELVAARSDAKSTSPVWLLDAACGRSYLTLLVAYTLEHVHGMSVRVLAVDRSEALVRESARRTQIAGLERIVRHRAGALATFDAVSACNEEFGETRSRIDAVLALHACDTATDDAIVLGVRSGATLVAVTPCCQAELASAWKALGEDNVSAFAPVHTTPHLRREAAALVTDTMRTLLLRGAGYESWALELVPTEHTPKNTLLRAMKRGARDRVALQQYDALVQATGGAGIALAERLESIEQKHTQETA